MAARAKHLVKPNLSKSTPPIRLPNIENRPNIDANKAADINSTPDASKLWK